MITVTTREKKNEIKEVVNNIDVSPTQGLQILREKANSIQNVCHDFLLKDVSLSNFAAYISEPYSVKAKFFSDEQVNTRFMTDYAFGQLCGKLGIPARYLEKCAKNGYTELAQKNLNTWIDAYEKDLFLRCYQDKIRGVLSNRYSVLDTPEIIDVVDEATRGLNLKVKGFYMSEERFHARLIQQDMMKINGEDLYAGIQIDSSDIGRSPLNVVFFIYKQICTNGLAISKGKGQLFKQRHISISTDDFREQLSSSLKVLPILISEYEHIIQRCAIQYSIMGTKFVSDKIIGSVLNEFIQKIKYKTNLSDDGVKKVVDLVGVKYGPSDWGVINAITEVAQDYTLERRIELERIAGSMLKIS